MKVIYKNWKGKVAARSIIPQRIEFRISAWHGEQPNWILVAHDIEKGEGRDFLLRDFIEFDCEELGEDTIKEIVEVYNS